MTPTINDLIAKLVAVYSRAGHFHMILADMIARQSNAFSAEIKSMNDEMVAFTGQGIADLHDIIESQQSDSE